MTYIMRDNYIFILFSALHHRRRLGCDEGDDGGPAAGKRGARRPPAKGAAGVLLLPLLGVDPIQW